MQSMIQFLKKDGTSCCSHWMSSPHFIIFQLLLFFLTKKTWCYLYNLLTNLETNLALDFVREGMVDSLIKLQQDLQGKLGTNLLWLKGYKITLEATLIRYIQ